MIDTFIPNIRQSNQQGMAKQLHDFFEDKADKIRATIYALNEIGLLDDVTIIDNFLLTEEAVGSETVKKIYAIDIQQVGGDSFRIGRPSMFSSEQQLNTNNLKNEIETQIQCLVDNADEILNVVDESLLEAGLPFEQVAGITNKMELKINNLKSRFEKDWDGLRGEGLVDETIVAKPKPTVQAKTTTTLKESFGITNGAKGHQKILTEYVTLESKVIGKDYTQYGDELIEVAKATEADECTISSLEDLIVNFQDEGKKISPMEGEFQYPKNTKLNGNEIRKDVSIYKSHLKKRINEIESSGRNIDEIITAERDMDIMGTALRTDGSLPPTKRVVLTRDDFGGGNSPMYTAMKKALSDAKTEASKFPEGPSRFTNFDRIVKENMAKVIQQYETEMSVIWNNKVAPHISGSGDIIFSDVGLKGTMQFWKAVMFERFFPGKKAYIDLLFTRNAPGPDGFRGYVRTPSTDQFIGGNNKPSDSEFRRFFGRNTGEAVPRIIEPDGTGRKFIEVNKQNIEEFIIGMLRYWFAANPAS
tara:strand:- start:354 stop:1946 length:1593 start_codon:yes stop_codon:yes gene_type:complete